MDEGFTSFIDAVGEQSLRGVNAFKSSYRRYRSLVKSGLEEPLTTHADRFATNRAYGTGSYSKGSVFLSQLAYVIGTDALLSSLQKFYQYFAFTHPTANDFKRVAEKVSGIQLEWYLNDWTRTTKTIDYAIKNVTAKGDQTVVVLERIGEMGMPIDLGVLYKSGKQVVHNIPLQMMFGEKPPLNGVENWVVEKDWAWARPTYTLVIDSPLDKINQILIDPTELMADINLDNNVFKNGE